VIGQGEIYLTKLCVFKMSAYTLRGWFYILPWTRCCDEHLFDKI
jgi:hypothetical protein